MLQDRGVAEMRIHGSWGSGSQALSPVWCVHPLPLIMLNFGAIAESHIKIKITWSKQKWSLVWKGRLQLSAAWVVPHGGGCSYPFMAPRRPLLVCFWVWLFKLENHLVQPLILQRRKVRSACAVCMLSRFSHVQLFETIWIVARQGPLSMGILQAILEWVATPSSRGSSRPRDQTCISLLHLLHWQAGSLLLVTPGKAKSSVRIP